MTAIVACGVGGDTHESSPELGPGRNPDLSEEDVKLVAALRAGDEQAFASLVDRYWSTLVHVARAYVASREAAEDVVQDTWVGVVDGIDRFEGRSSLKTWIFRILVNQARKRGEREARVRPLEVEDDAVARRTRLHELQFVPATS